MEVVLDDLTSEASVPDIAQYASRGQSATQQRITVAGVAKDLIEGKSKGGGVVSQLVQNIGAAIGAKNRAAKRELVFEALMNPEVFKDLILRPTPKNIEKGMMSLNEFVTQAIKTQSNTAKRLGLISTGRAILDNESQSLPKSAEELYSSIQGSQENPGAYPDYESKSGYMSSSKNNRTGYLGNTSYTEGSLYGGKKSEYN